MSEEAATEPRLREDPALRGRGLDRGEIVSRYWPWVAVVALAIAVWLPRLNGPIDLRYDGGVYYLLGSSLASGHGYRIPSEPGSPKAIQYPPLLPAITAAYQRIIGIDDFRAVGGWLRKSYFLLYVAYAWALLALARKYLSKGFAFLAAALCLLNFETIFLSDLLFAELPFAVVGAVFALVAGNAKTLWHGSLREFVSYLLATAGFLLRTAGLALFAAWILDALIRRRWKLAAARSAMALVPVLAWQIYVARVVASEEYAHPAYGYQRASYQYYNVSYAENMRLVDPFRPELGPFTATAFASRMLTNAPSVLTALGEAISARGSDLGRLFNKAQRKLFHRVVIPKGVVYFPILGLTILILAGIILLLRRRAWVMVFVVVFSVGLVWTTPWPGQFTRYLVPLSPFLAIPAMLALAEWRTRQLQKGGSRRLMHIAIAGVVSLAFATEAYPSARLFRARSSAEGMTVEPAGSARERLFAHDSQWQRWENAVNWLAVHAPHDAIIATSAPHWLYLRTGLRAVLPPMDADPVRARQLLEAVPVSYVIVDELGFLDISRRYAGPAVEGDPAGWRLVNTFGGTNIYERAR
ncbi:MAG: hypothetical protein H0X73_14240 [Chthoniobacterales bacterium]|nr:hypothetical protein [Chthoniobacterales bacterium]